MKRELMYIARLMGLVIIPLLAVTALVVFLTEQYVDSSVLVVVILVVYTTIATAITFWWIFWLIEQNVI